MSFVLRMAPGTKTILSPVKNVPYADLAALRAATAALVAAATAINVKAQATSPAPLSEQQQKDIADSIAAATYQLDLVKKNLAI